MKIEKLTDNKIRIIIDLDELSEKNIDVNSLIKNNDTAHVLFQTILNEAEKQVGFKVQNCKLLVEAFSTTDGYVLKGLDIGEKHFQHHIKTQFINSIILMNFVIFVHIVIQVN